MNAATAQIHLSEMAPLSAPVKKKFVIRPAALPARYTDQRVKLHFAGLYKGTAQYVPGIGWHQWTGTRWSTDTPGGLYPLIDKMQEDLMRAAKEIKDEEARAKDRKALINLESHDRQTTIIKACEHVPDLITQACDLDKDNMLLNVANGTLDLSTGRLQPHNPADRITRVINIDYDPGATCPTFMKFLKWAMCSDADLVLYLQRFIGYCLTGDISEQVLNFWYGTGGNGKSTLMNVIQWLLCDYGTCADTGLIMKAEAGGTDSNRLYMLAELRGARLVTLSEVNDGQKLDEAQIKSFTGGDVITARQVYERPFSYVPQAKLIGFGNYRPHVRGTDYGIWRRIHLVPFAAVITDADKDTHLADKLRNELPGILNWAVQGCLAWQEQGLHAPNAIKAAVEGYRQNEDTFQSWLSECCSRDESKRTASAQLTASFKEYSGWRISDKKFSELMKYAGFEKRFSNGTFWLGIFLGNGGMEGLKENPQQFTKYISPECLGICPPSLQPSIFDASNEKVYMFDESDLMPESSGFAL